MRRVRRGRAWCLVLLLAATGGVAVAAVALQPPRPPVPLLWVTRGTALAGYWAVYLTIVSSAEPAVTRRLFGQSFRTVHYVLSVTGLVLITAHPIAVALVVGSAGVFVPTVAPWSLLLQEGGRPAWYLFLLTSALTLVRRRIGTWWRTLHLLTYAAFWLATGHALLIGRTHASPALRTVTVAMALSAGAVMIYRHRGR